MIHGGEAEVVRTKNGWGPDTQVGVAFPLPPGHVRIGGLETTVTAAITAGLLPANWKAGDPVPFDGTSGANGVHKPTPEAPNAAQKDTKGSVDEHMTPREQVWKGHVDEASRVLHGVSQLHGPSVTDHHVANAAERGEIDAASLPEGVSVEMAQAVYRGYAAQANNDLASVNASVDLLTEMLGADELRLARKAVVMGDKDHLRSLGHAAVERLSQEPQKDPERFLTRLEGMPAAERKCLYQNKNTGEWMVTLPGRQPMSFGAAVRLGIVKTA
ncbi:hypothetical protein [Haematobacter massiliensis]|uniref:hypothetical protein n=1 Tax=Haematobacter massiliensis TaxID=195105 RepID=UPI00103F6336|nr:hypothetical protein [Haematobacter massiliensis]QBJ23418.1 hypothetical protein HmaOT1_03555 [Haematobacter massiliensis]